MESEKVERKEFTKLTKDFINDILNTFPEQKEDLDNDLKDIYESEGVESIKVENIENLWKYCSSIYPERFFDILYQNTDIFKDDSEINCKFLPNIDFKQLWKCDISDKTRETIWKYLQLILFAVVAEIRDGASFGETAKLFEAINEEELKKKLEEAVSQMQSLFENGENGASFNFSDISNISLGDLPNPEELHNHITSMMEGKLGKLAREIAEETAQELQLEMEGSTDINDVFKRLFKNPTRIMDLVKSVGSKMENKLKSGEIKESELLQEAGDLMNKMKNMPGMGNMQNILSKMGMPGLGKGAKLNLNAMQSALNQNIKSAQAKDRMRAKLAKRQQEQQSGSMENLGESDKFSFIQGNNPNEFKFVGEEKAERSLKTEAPTSEKKKKNKKKKVKKDKKVDEENTVNNNV